MVEINREPESCDPSDSNDLLAGALTDDLGRWFQDWSGGEELKFEAKVSIYMVIAERLESGIEV